MAKPVRTIHVKPSKTGTSVYIMEGKEQIASVYFPPTLKDSLIKENINLYMNLFAVEITDSIKEYLKDD